MKKIISIAVAIICFATTQAQGYKVTVQTPDYKSGIAYLAYHFGPSLDVQDSAFVSDKGIMVFSGSDTLQAGIYAIVFPGKTQTMDFLIDKEQKITITKADTTDLLNKTIIKGSKENDLFEQYQKNVQPLGKLLEKEKKAYETSTTKADSTLHLNNFKKYNKQVEVYRDTIISKYPNSMLSVLFLAMKDPKLLTDKPVTHQDSVDNFNYYKAHYWDGISFMDDRIIRTPFFMPKLQRYYENVISQDPDSIIAESDYQLLLARTCPEMYKFLLNWFTDEFFYPKYMGQDAILVHLFEQYHSQGLSPWLNKKQQDAISRRAYMEMSNLIGKQGADLQLLDSSGKVASLYDVQAAYTVVCFWDPTCGHCKIEIPKIDSVYKASWKQHDVKIYAVLTENVVPEWKKYIKENDLGDWTNVYETPEMEKADEDAQKASFRQLYDVTSTPTLYLLDKDKRIVVKKLSWEQINEFLQTKWATKTTDNKSKQ